MARLQPPRYLRAWFRTTLCKKTRAPVLRALLLIRGDGYPFPFTNRFYCTVMVVEAVIPLAFAPMDVVPTP